MNRKLIAIPVLLLFLTITFAPVVSEGTETNDDIVIPPIDDVTLNYGTSTQIQFTMLNTSVTDYMFQFKDYDHNGIHISYAFEGSPEIASGGHKFVVATIAVDKYTHKGDYGCSIDISLINLASGTSSEKTIPLTVTVTSYYSGDAFNKILGLFVIPGIDSPELNAAITFVIWIIITCIVVFLYNAIVSWAFKNDSSKGKDKRKIAGVWVLAIMLYGIYNTLLVYGANERILDLFWTILQFVYIILVAFIVWDIYRSIVNHFFHKMESKEGFEGMDTSLIPLFNMIGKVVIVIVGTAVFLATLGVNIVGILTGAGILGLAVSLGAQNTLTEIFGGMTLMITRPFIKEDMIRLNDESAVYEVVDIHLLTTEFKEWSNTPHIIIPNSVVAKSKITNLTSIPDAYRVYLYVGVAYDSDTEIVRKAMVESAKEHPHVLKDKIYPEPEVRLESFDDSCITFRLAAYVDNFDDSTIYMGEIRELIVRKLNANGISIPYPICDVNIEE